MSIAVSCSLFGVSGASSGQAEATSIVSTQEPASVGQVKQGDDDVIRVDTNLVTILASVINRDAKYITDLRKEDFQIFENGVSQDVAFFAPVEQPFTILFLLDVSGPIPYLVELARAANAFASQLRPDDQLMAISFSGSGWFKVT